jgi:hypothetical protein
VHWPCPSPPIRDGVGLRRGNGGLSLISRDE